MAGGCLISLGFESTHFLLLSLFCRGAGFSNLGEHPALLSTAVQPVMPRSQPRPCTASPTPESSALSCLQLSPCQHGDVGGPELFPTAAPLKGLGHPLKNTAGGSSMSGIFFCKAFPLLPFLHFMESTATMALRIFVHLIAWWLTTTHGDAPAPRECRANTRPWG